MSCLEVCYSYFRWCEYFWGRSVSFVTVDEFSVRVTKITSRIVVSWTISLSSVFCFWRKLNNFESQSSLKLSFTNIRGLRSNFVKCESFHQLILLLFVRQTWLNWIWQFLCKRLLSINLKGFCCSSQFMWGKDFLLHGTYLYKTLQIVTYVLGWLYFTQCLTSSFYTDHILRLYVQFLMLFHIT